MNIWDDIGVSKLSGIFYSGIELFLQITYYLYKKKCLYINIII